jgi:hypothetical protein
MGTAPEVLNTWDEGNGGFKGVRDLCGDKLPGFTVKLRRHRMTGVLFVQCGKFDSELAEEQQVT